MNIRFEHFNRLFGNILLQEIIGIDGCKFHENMNQFENGHDDEQIKRMLAPIKDIRLWQ